MPPPQTDEANRLAALARLDLMDTEAESAYDRLTELARHLFGTRLALVTLVGRQRQWVKSRSGPEDLHPSIPRGDSFCTEMIADDAPLICEDATRDPRFRDKPLVCNEPGIRFYAGIPLRPDGEAIVGSLCILDDKPRAFSETDLWTLSHLAQQVEELLRFHLARLEQEEDQRQTLIANARFGALIAGASVGIIRAGEDGIIQDANPFALSLLDHHERGLRGESLQRILPDFPVDDAHHHVTRETGALTSRGLAVPVQATLTRVALADDPGCEFIIILTDLSDIRDAEAQSRRERAFLRSIIDATHDPIYVKNRDGEYVLTNQAIRDLIGAKSDEALKAIKPRQLYPKEMLSETEAAEARILSTGEPETLTFDIVDGRSFRISKSPLYDGNGAIHGIVNVAHDVTEYWRMNEALRERERELDRQSHLLRVLHAGLTDYEALMSGDRLWHFLLDALRELTGSDYGLIGEVTHTDGNEPALRIHAITDLAWNNESRELMEDLRRGDMTLSRPESLLGKVFASGKTIISHAPMTDERGVGLPEGHPPLHSYMGVPIRHNGELIGMYAIANGRYEYDQAMLEWLEPFTATCALLINLSRHFDERDRFTRELARARDDAEEASKAKTRFLSAMSHELRTPLNSILGFAQLLGNSRRSSLEGRQQRQVEQIQRSGQHLLELINEVLDLARVESGRIQLSVESLHSGEAAREALDTIAGMAETHGIGVTMHGDPDQWPLVQADFTRLKQVLLNLISNAIKYNRAQGEVQLYWTLAGDYALLHCEDTGNGIDPDKQNQLFEPFDRLGADQAIEGTGIGLALTRRLVEAMDGWINVVSEVGVGTDFHVALPLAETVPDTAGSAEAAGAVARAADSAERRILYVEDNPANQRLMQEAFEDYPELELICVHSAELALDMVNSHNLDLILMDLNLPGMDGETALRRLRDNPATRNLPVVAVSANAMYEDVRRGLKAGFADYLTKPVDIGYLFEHLLDWIHQRPE